ncbi:MAG: hypothetical protein OEZ43_15795 [Gammaproteobacteria bacterium]|nr:hypothetical protein [Gammaproteobacteria bacterium]
MASEAFLFDVTLTNFLESDVAFLVASCDENQFPIISRGFGARVSDDCTQLTVFVTDRQSQRILADIEKNGHISVNAARITTYESYQLKGDCARRVELSIKDQRHVMQYVDDVQSQMLKVGLTPEQAAAVFQSQENENLVGICFTPRDVFVQTPGPGAGKRRERGE